MDVAVPRGPQDDAPGRKRRALAHRSPDRRCRHRAELLRGAGQGPHLPDVRLDDLPRWHRRHDADHQRRHPQEMHPLPRLQLQGARLPPHHLRRHQGPQVPQPHPVGRRRAGRPRQPYLCEPALCAGRRLGGPLCRVRV
eukprot:Amastigsp_a2295_27.p3 type:complete len:139 gc:universal Amastigsp_a2295_27:968-1384(+)